jgi:O-antigen/teichoic acid export membrane protein
MLSRLLPAQVAPGIVGFVSIPIVARVFPPAEYGSYCLVTATLAILTTLFGWLPTSILRYYPAYARQERLDVFKATILRLGTIAMLTLTALYYGALLVLRTWMSARLWHLMTVGGLLFTVTCAFDLLQCVLRSKRFAGRYSTFAIWQSVTGFALGITLAVVLGFGIEGLLLGPALSIVSVLPLLWRQAMERDRPIRFGRMDREAVRAMFVYGVPLVVGNLAAWILGLSDRYILGVFRNSAEVGLYSLSYNIADKSLMLLIALFTMASGPLGMHIWENSGERDSSQFVSHVTRLYLLMCVPPAVGLSVLSRLVVGILGGQAYVSERGIVPFVLFGVLLFGLQQRFHYGLLFHRKTGRITMAIVIAGALNVILNLLFVPAYGYFAAAVTTLVCYGALLLLVIRFSRRLFVWNFPYRSLFNAAAASGVMGAVVHITGRHSGLTPVATLFLCVGIGAAVYLTILLLLGEFTSQELQLIGQTTRRALAAVQSIAGPADSR